MTADVIVIGSGVAGLSAALSATEAGARVTVVTKAALDHTATDRAQGGMAAMKKLDAIDVPARSTVKFEPGGRHVMLWSVNPQAIADGKMSFTFIFSNGDRIIADAVVQKPDGSAATPAGNAAGEDHSGH